MKTQTQNKQTRSFVSALILLLGVISTIEPARAAPWITTSLLHVARDKSTATLLLNGKVLIAGGIGNSSPGTTNSAELYDPATGTSTLTGSMKPGDITTPRPCCPTARCWWSGASPSTATSPIAPNSTIPPPEPGQRPLPWFTFAFITRALCCPAARSWSLAAPAPISCRAPNCTIQPPEPGRQPAQ